MKLPFAYASTALALLCLPQLGAAGVLAPPETHYWVGTGVGCSHATIQAAVDSAASNSDDVIHLTRSLTYLSESVLVQDKSLVFQGGHETCGDFSVSGTTTVSGQGQLGTPLSVFRIRGASRVAIRGLYITGGHPDPNSSGGGISFEGTGELSLGSTEVVGNRAGRGGGVALIAQNGSAALRLWSGTVIAENLGEHGGGVYVEGEARLFALVDGILIAGNKVNSSGGGLALARGARADIGSPGALGQAVISSNIAAQGGGIAIYGARDDVASSLRLFSTDARRPVSLRHNVASNAGGALWVGTAEVNPGQAGVQVCARDLRIEDNAAADGAAIFVGNPFASAPIGNFADGTVSFNADAGTTCGVENDEPSGAVACASGVTCNTIARNLARDIVGEPTDGATVALDSDSLFSAARMIWRGNRGGNVLRFEGMGHTVTLDTCLIAQNTVSREVLRASGFGSFVALRDCTVAGNDIAATRVFASDSSLGLQTSIIDAPGKTTFVALGADGEIVAVDVIASEVASLPASSNIVAGTVAFVDAEAGNFRLMPDTMAVDFAPSHGGIDLDGTMRPHDAPRAERFGPHDLGAYEWNDDPAPGFLFGDHFEVISITR